MSRGTLKSEKKKGTVYVLLKADRSRSTANTSNDTSHYANDRSADIMGDPTSLISAKEETIRLLTEQLEAERAASAELRRIVAGLVQRVAEVESAKDVSEPPEAPVSASEGTDKGSRPQSSRSPQSAARGGVSYSGWSNVHGGLGLHGLLAEIVRKVIR